MIRCPTPGGFNIGSLTTSASLSAHTISLSDFANQLQNLVAGTSSSGAGAFRTASIFFGGFLSFLLIVILSFYLSVQEEGVAEFLRIITPVSNHKYVIDLWNRSQRKIGFWLQGQVLLGILIGVLVYLVLSVVGIPYALPLALLAALFEIIPVFGPIISSVTGEADGHAAAQAGALAAALAGVAGRAAPGAGAGAMLITELSPSASMTVISRTTAC